MNEWAAPKSQKKWRFELHFEEQIREPQMWTAEHGPDYILLLYIFKADRPYKLMVMAEL